MSETKKYTEEFKKQIVMLYNNGKSGVELAREYGMIKSAIYDWSKKYNQSGSFEVKDNISENKLRLKELEEENKQLRMENDLLK